jgi:hypothetical protein
VGQRTQRPRPARRGAAAPAAGACVGAAPGRRLVARRAVARCTRRAGRPRG